MGNVLHLRKPSRKLGYDDVMLVPRESIADTARAVLASPDDNTESMLRAACIWLRDNGDWLDQERARHMLKVLEQQQRLTFAQNKHSDLSGHKFGLACFVLFLIVVGISLLDNAWGAQLAAGLAR